MKRQPPATRNIRCACGRTVRCRPNGNGVVLCPECRSAFTVAQFARPCPPAAIVHDFTRRN